MAQDDTIFALSSGRLPSGIAVVRVSGVGVRDALTALAGVVPAPRLARLRLLRDPATGEMLDHALVLFFPGPASAIGEDLAEFHLHGGRAVVAAVLRVLGQRPGLRPAEAGEFTRRAHANGKMDLAEVEGLADLIAAETEAQRRQALAQASGALSRRVTAWRDNLVRVLALVEAGIDFSDEGDVSEDLTTEALAEIGALRDALEVALRDAERGERVRDGFVVALAGLPNAGKSSLLNRLVGRDAAIVSDRAGTTRDVLEVQLDLAGQAVTLLDMAGLRETADAVEAEGVRRARARAEGADLVLWLSEHSELPPPELQGALAGAILVRTKVDLAVGAAADWVAISTLTGEGLEELLAMIEKRISALAGEEPALVTRERQRLGIAAACSHLEAALGVPVGAEELRAEELRLAARALDHTIGRVDVEDVLDTLFSAFCIGK